MVQRNSFFSKKLHVQTPLKILARFRFLPCRKLPGLRFFWTPGGRGVPPPIAPSFGFDFGRFLADFWPILAIFGHFLTKLGTMGVGVGPLPPPPCSFWGRGDPTPYKYWPNSRTPMGVLRSWAIPPCLVCLSQMSFRAH